MRDPSPPGDMSRPTLTVIVLTYQEVENLPHLLESGVALQARWLVVDSGSSDGTQALARRYGCQVVEHPFESQAQQLNWALDAIEIDTPWIMRMDADERFTPELVEELRSTLDGFEPDVTGLLVKRQVWFWGRWVRHGGYYPTWLLRTWRTGEAVCEQRWMDEHMVLRGGTSQRLAHDIIDENHKGLGFWIDKHNRYADREVLDLLDRAAAEESEPADQAGRRRWAKTNIYYRLPPYLRAFCYWSFRYFLQRGFLDGRAGLVFHFLQGLWYRLLVDAKLEEVRHEERRMASPTRIDAPLPASASMGRNAGRRATDGVVGPQPRRAREGSREDADARADETAELV